MWIGRYVEEEDELGSRYHIHPSTDEKFRGFIMEKYGTFKKGFLMEEANKALLHYMASQNTHTHARAVNVSSTSDIPRSILELKQRMLKFLIDTGRYVKPKRILLKHVREAIAAIKGTDPRTVTKYLRQLTEYQIIRANDLGGFDFVLDQGDELYYGATDADNSLSESTLPLELV